MGSKRYVIIYSTCCWKVTLTPKQVEFSSVPPRASFLNMREFYCGHIFSFCHPSLWHFYGWPLAGLIQAHPSNEASEWNGVRMPLKPLRADNNFLTSPSFRCEGSSVRSQFISILYCSKMAITTSGWYISHISPVTKKHKYCAHMIYKDLEVCRA